MTWLLAVAEVVVINRQDGTPALVEPPQSPARQVLAIAVTLGISGAVASGYGLLGYPLHD